MKILLINNNPVVSRLTALSARKEGVKLDEIKDISELKENDYNIVFVDIESFNSEVANFLKDANISKRVCFYSQDNKDVNKIFNFEILKPFLPSEVSAIIRDTKIEMEQEDDLNLEIGTKEPKEEHINLNELISTKKDDLEPIKIEKDIIKNEKQVEEKLLDELNLPKEQIDEIKKENLNLETPIEKKEEPKIELNQEVEKPIKAEIADNELFELDNNTIEDSELFSIDTEKNIDKTEDKILDFDIESKNEVNFDTQKEKREDSTKILDKDEINNIKNLLNEETSNIIEKSTVLTEPIKKKKKKKSKKIKDKTKEKKVAVDVITDTIKTMPVEELRQLLRGTKIHITIEFPNDI